MGRGTGRQRGVREAHSDLHIPTELSKTKTREQRTHRRSRGTKTQVDSATVEALKFGVQADKKRMNYDKFKDAKKSAKRERRAVRREQRRATGAGKLVPKTKENMRAPALGMVDDANDVEIRRDEQMDEFSAFYAQTREKIPEVDDEKNEEDEEAEWVDSEGDIDDEELLKQNDDEFIEQRVKEEGRKARDAAKQAKLAEKQRVSNGNDDDAEGEAAGDGEDHDHDNDEDELLSDEEGEEDDDSSQPKKKKPAERRPKVKNPTILFTTCKRPHFRTRLFVREALQLFPNSTFRSRRNYTLTEINTYCTEYGFKFVICIGERIKQPFEMIVSHLPEGPTATFRISNFLPHKELEEPAERTKHYPELNLKNFDTRLGRRVARIFEAMFPATRDYAGRAIATFHNQRDFIFVRTHRYIFDGMEAVRIQELGPRFTLRLMSLQKGTFDSRFGEYEWIRKKVHDTDKLEWFL